MKVPTIPLGKKIVASMWPDVDKDLLIENRLNLPIQINGKFTSTISTEKGYREFEHQLKILQDKWNELENTYKSGNKQELEQKLKEDKSFLPSMMMFGIIDMMMFSMMFSMIGSSIGSFIPSEDMGGADNDTDGMGGSDTGDDGGFDIDIGF